MNLLTQLPPHNLNLFALRAVQSFDKLRTNGVGVQSPLNDPFALSLMELLAIRLGCHKTPTKSLVMRKGELMQRADLKK